jgi:hypothetical protein
MAGIYTLERLVVRVGIDARQYLKGMDEVDSRAMKSAKRVTILGSRLTLGVTVPLAVMGGTAVREFGRFDKAMTASLALLKNVTPEIRKEMEGVAKAISLRSTSSPTQLAQAYGELASAGFNAKESMQSLASVERFAVAGAIDLAKATRLLAGSVSALGMRGKGNSREAIEQTRRAMEEVGDVLVTAKTLALGTVEDFADALENKAGAAMRNYNIRVQEGVAVLAAYAQQNITGRLAGSKFDIMLREMDYAWRRNQETWKNAQVDLYDLSGGLRNIGDIINDLDESLDGLTVQQQRASLHMMGFRARSLAAILPLLGMGHAIQEYEQKLDDAAGSTAEMAEKQLQALASQAAIARNHLLILAGELSEVLRPALEMTFGIVKDVVGFMRDLSDTSKTVIVTSIALAAAVGPLIAVYGSLRQVTEGIISLFRRAPKAMAETAAQTSALARTAQTASRAHITAQTAIQTSYANLITAATNAGATQRAQQSANVTSTRSTAAAVTAAVRAQVAAQNQLQLATATGSRDAIAAANAAMNQANATHRTATAQAAAARMVRDAFMSEIDATKALENATILAQRAKVADARAAQSQAFANLARERSARAVGKAMIPHHDQDLRLARASHLVAAAATAQTKANYDLEKSQKLTARAGQAEVSSSRAVTNALISRDKASKLASGSMNAQLVALTTTATATSVLDTATQSFIADQNVSAISTNAGTAAILRNSQAAIENANVTKGAATALGIAQANRAEQVLAIEAQTAALEIQNKALVTNANLMATQGKGVITSATGAAQTMAGAAGPHAGPTGATLRGVAATAASAAQAQASLAQGANAVAKAMHNENVAVANLIGALREGNAQSIAAAQSQLKHAESVARVATSQEALLKTQAQALSLQNQLTTVTRTAPAAMKSLEAAESRLVDLHMRRIKLGGKLTEARRIEVAATKTVTDAWDKYQAAVARGGLGTVKAGKELDAATKTLRLAEARTAKLTQAVQKNAYDYKAATHQVANYGRALSEAVAVDSAATTRGSAAISLNDQKAVQLTKELAKAKRDEVIARRAVVPYTKAEHDAQGVLNQAMATGNRESIQAARNTLSQVASRRMMIEADRAHFAASSNLIGVQSALSRARSVEMGIVLRSAQATIAYKTAQRNAAMEMALHKNMTNAYLQSVANGTPQIGLWQRSQNHLANSLMESNRASALSSTLTELDTRERKANAAVMRLQQREMDALTAKQLTGQKVASTRQYASTVAQGPIGTGKQNQQLAMIQAVEKAQMKLDQARASGSAHQMRAAQAEIDYTQKLLAANAAQRAHTQARWDANRAGHAFVAQRKAEAAAGATVLKVNWDSEKVIRRVAELRQKELGLMARGSLTAMDANNVQAMANAQREKAAKHTAASIFQMKAANAAELQIIQVRRQLAAETHFTTTAENALKKARATGIGVAQAERALSTQETARRKTAATLIDLERQKKEALTLATRHSTASVQMHTAANYHDAESSRLSALATGQSDAAKMASSRADRLAATASTERMVAEQAATAAKQAGTQAELANAAAKEAGLAASVAHIGAVGAEVGAVLAARNAKVKDSLATVMNTTGIFVNTAALNTNAKMRRVQMAINALATAQTQQDTAAIIANAAILKTHTQTLWLGRAGLTAYQQVASMGSMTVVAFTAAIKASVVSMWVWIKSMIFAKGALWAKISSIYAAVAAMFTLEAITALLAATTVAWAAAILLIPAAIAGIAAVLSGVTSLWKEWAKAQEDAARINQRLSAMHQERIALIMEEAEAFEGNNKAGYLEKAIKNEQDRVKAANAALNAKKEEIKQLDKWYRTGGGLAGFIFTTDVSIAKEELKTLQDQFDSATASAKELEKAGRKAGLVMNEATGRMESGTGLNSPEMRAKAESLGKAVENLNEKFRDSQFVLDMTAQGFTANQIEVLKLKEAFGDLLGDDEFKDFMDWAGRLDASEKQKDLTKAIQDANDSLRAQIDKHNKSKGQSVLYDLSKLGVADDKLGETRALAKQLDDLDALEEKQKDFNKLLEDAKSITESIRTPQEVYKDTVDKLNDLLMAIDPKTGLPLITHETHTRALKKAQEDMDNALKGTKTEQNKRFIDRPDTMIKGSTAHLGFAQAQMARIHGESKKIEGFSGAPAPGVGGVFVDDESRKTARTPHEGKLEKLLEQIEANTKRDPKDNLPNPRGRLQPAGGPNGLSNRRR